MSDRLLMSLYGAFALIAVIGGVLLLTVAVSTNTPTNQLVLLVLAGFPMLAGGMIGCAIVDRLPSDHDRYHQWMRDHHGGLP